MLCLLLSVFVAAYLLWPKKRSIDVRKFCRKYSDEKVSVMCNSCFNNLDLGVALRPGWEPTHLPLPIPAGAWPIPQVQQSDIKL